MAKEDDKTLKRDDKAEEGEETCCDSPKISQEDGYYVCLNCGCIYSRVLDNSPRRAFTRDEMLRRKTNERIYSPIGPRTVIRGNKDAYGSLLSPKYKSKFHRLGKIHRSLTTSFERNLWIALPNLQRLQKQLKLPDYVAEDSIRIYTQTVKEKLTMGRSIDMLLAASIYAAIRVHGVPRTIEELVEVSQVKKKKLLKSFRLICLEIMPKFNLKIKRMTPSNYVNKFGEELQLSMKCRKQSIDLIDKVKKQGFFFSGKDPKGIAAAALYICSKLFNEHRTQKEISTLANITEVTLRARVKDFKKYGNLI
ncbi:MAG: Transcription initiation factor IIB [Promethearchaeota archaeon]|nr:MAG: Transcription initiation factor IIB [Candidatus Lokiarchaeota archaeon]